MPVLGPSIRLSHRIVVLLAVAVVCSVYFFGVLGLAVSERPRPSASTAMALRHRTSLLVLRLCHATGVGLTGNPTGLEYPEVLKPGDKRRHLVRNPTPGMIPCRSVQHFRVCSSAPLMWKCFVEDSISSTQTLKVRTFPSIPIKITLTIFVLCFGSSRAGVASCFPSLFCRPRQLANRARCSDRLISSSGPPLASCRD